jgi:membrane protein
MRIPGLRGVSPRVVASESVREFMDDDMGTYGAALTYHVFFALFPFLLFLIALLGVLRLQGFFDWLLAQARMVLPRDALGLVEGVIQEVQTQRDGGLVSLGILVAVLAASAGVRSTMNALNTAYDVEEGRPLWKRYALSVVYTVALAVMVILAAGLMFIGPQVMEWIAKHVGLGELIVVLWTWLRIPVAALLLMLAVSIVYYAAPNVDQEFRYVTPGSVLAVVLWVVVSLAFSFYVSRFANYGATYGSIGAVIVLMLYIYVSSLAFLMGGEVNAVIEHHVPKAKGPREPAEEEQRLRG